MTRLRFELLLHLYCTEFRCCLFVRLLKLAKIYSRHFLFLCGSVMFNIKIYYIGPGHDVFFGYRETLLLNVKCSLGLTVKFIANLARMQSPTDQFPIFIS